MARKLIIASVGAIAVSILTTAFLMQPAPARLVSPIIMPSSEVRDEAIVAEEIKGSTVELVREKIFGVSAMGRKINGYEIGLGQECVLFLGGIHGNEPGTSLLLQTLLEVLVASPDLVSPSKKVIVIPRVNPDGFHDRSDNLNANGVNLNRNFATAGWARNLDSGTFAGERPFSEKESQAVRGAIEECGTGIMLAFHAQGTLVSPEAGEESVALADWYAGKTGYSVYDEWNYFGTATAWFVEATGNPAITVELSTHEGSDWERNKEALLELIST